ncbi:hypothetical protein JCM19238_1342 [Vibrio ponticus]|nr:hypothetical protein JCM19238_1342 [Vibrio ponticus]
MAAITARFTLSAIVREGNLLGDNVTFKAASNVVAEKADIDLSDARYPRSFTKLQG